MYKNYLAVVLLIMAMIGANTVFAGPGCGGVNQNECTIFQQVPSCNKSLAAKDGKCHECGGHEQMECPATVQFPSCDRMHTAWNGYCWKCGGENERTCAITVGPACGSGLKPNNQGDYCMKACGGLGEAPCSKDYRTTSCDTTQNLILVNGECVPRNTDEEIRNLAERDSKSYISYIVESLQLTLDSLNESVLQNSINNGAPNQALAGIQEYRPFQNLQNRVANSGANPLFNTLTIGLAGGATAGVVNARADTGFAFDIRPNRPLAIQWYGGASYEFSIGLSGNVGLNIGVWTPQYTSLRGDMTGVTLDLATLVNSISGSDLSTAHSASEAVQGLQDIKEAVKQLKNGGRVKTGFDLIVTMWYSKTANPQLKGLTATPVVAAGGAVYNGGISYATMGQ